MGDVGRPLTLGGAVLAAALLVGVAAPAPAQVRVVTERDGPVVLGDGPGRAVIVEKTYEEATGVPPEGWKRTLTRLRFRAQSGRLLYQETLESRLVAGQGFDGETSAGPARELRGSPRRFLLLPLGFDPSAPSSGSVLVVYGFDARGQFRRLGAPFEGPGTDLVNPADAGGKVVRLREGRYLDIASWTSHFTLILPWQFHDEREGFELARPCGPVTVEPRSPEDSVVTLHRKRGGQPPAGQTRDLWDLAVHRSVPVRPGSKIEFLEGCRLYSQAGTGLFTTWLRVRIDGEEGWVSGEGQELDRLGLPAAD